MDIETILEIMKNGGSFEITLPSGNAAQLSVSRIGGRAALSVHMPPQIFSKEERERVVAVVGRLIELSGGESGAPFVYHSQDERDRWLRRWLGGAQG